MPRRMEGRWSHLYLHGTPRYDWLRVFCRAGNGQERHLLARGGNQLRTGPRAAQVRHEAFASVKVLRLVQVEEATTHHEAVDQGKEEWCADD